MSEIPTPETDAFAKIPSEPNETWKIAEDWRDFARKLERRCASLEALAFYLAAHPAPDEYVEKCLSEIRAEKGDGEPLDIPKFLRRFDD